MFPNEEDPNGFVPMENLKKKNLHVCFAQLNNKGQGTTSGAARRRTDSALSMQLPNELEVTRVKKVLVKQHEFKDMNPLAWNNIPICVAHAFAQIFTWAVDNDEHNFEY